MFSHKSTFDRKIVLKISYGYVRATLNGFNFSGHAKKNECSTECYNLASASSLTGCSINWLGLLCYSWHYIYWNSLTSIAVYYRREGGLQVNSRDRNRYGISYFFNCLPNLSTREKTLLPMLDVFGTGWIRFLQGAAASWQPRILADPVYYSSTSRDSPQTWSASLSR